MVQVQQAVHREFFTVSVSDLVESGGMKLTVYMDTTGRIYLSSYFFYQDSAINLFSSRRRTGSGINPVVRHYTEINILLNGDVRFDLSQSR